MASILIGDVLLDGTELRTSQTCITLNQMITRDIKLHGSKIWSYSDPIARFLYSFAEFQGIYQNMLHVMKLG